MMRFSNLTLRNALIAAHDALATALAVFASFSLRFEGDAFFDRLPLLLRILPYFVAFSVVICYAFNLTTTKWRFISYAVFCLKKKKEIADLITVFFAAYVVVITCLLFVL